MSPTPASQDNPLPSLTFVIEWENARLCDQDRSREMLAELSRQIAEVSPDLPAPAELLFIFDEQELGAGTVEGMVAADFKEPSLVEMRFVATTGQRYYQQKNVGAREAQGDVVIFIDSDVIPEPGWLRGLVEVLRDPAVEVVGGTAYIDPKSYIAKAFALFWFFSLRAEGDGLSTTTKFFANNVAFRRELITRCPFPDLPSQRGQCTILAQSLIRDGHTIHRLESSRVSHPEPNGIVHFIKRAISQGHDELVLGGLRQPQVFASPRANALRRIVKRSWKSQKKVVRDWKKVGFSRVEAVGASTLALAFAGLALAGFAMSLVNEPYVRKRFEC